jgi:hypothetical protein
MNKRKVDFMILMVNPWHMDPKVKAWYMEERAAILQ